MLGFFLFLLAVAAVLAFAGMAAPARWETPLFWGATLSGCAACWAFLALCLTIG